MKEKGKRTRKRKVPHLFGKLIVTWCISYATVTSAVTFYLLYKGIDATTALGIMLAFAGGELLTFAGKVILENKKGKKEKEEVESEECYGTDL